MSWEACKLSSKTSKKLGKRIEAVAKVTEGLEKKALNQNLAKEVATFTKRLVSLE